MKRFLKYHMDADRLLTLWLDAPEESSNRVSREFLLELSQTLDELKQGDAIAGMIIASKKKDFLEGPPLTAWQQLKNAEAAYESSQFMSGIFHKLAQLPFPTVCAIHGRCLGAGLELALACHWRLASTAPTTSFALPEIHLGLIPAGGGCQRLPQLIGLQAGLDMILTGRQVGVKKAMKTGLIDACIPLPQLWEQARTYALRKRRKRFSATISQPGELSKELPKWAIEGNLLGRRVIYKKTREMIDEKTHGFQPASYKALKAIADGYDLDSTAASQLASRLFAELLMSRQCQALTHLRLQEVAEESREPLAELGIVGAGLVGTGLATLCADIGLRVFLADGRKEAIGSALRAARGYFTKKLDRRRIQTFELHQRLAHICPSLSPLGFERLALVIDADKEDLRGKQELLRQLEEHASSHWIFASSTAIIPIAKIAQVARQPERVVGMHFFSPLEDKRLLEVAITPQTADWVIKQAYAFGQSLGKQVIVVKDSPGFYSTRTLAMYLAEALQLLAEGCPMETIDLAMRQFGFSQGPIALLDEVGLDVSFYTLQAMMAAFPHKLSLPSSLYNLLQSGRLGQKNAKGFYRYQEDERLSPDPEVYSLLQRPMPSYQPPPAVEEIVERCLMIFVNESVSCLEENILAKAADGDIGAVHGLGFPAVWGGPFKYLDFIGANRAVESLNRLVEKYGERFRPSPLLKSYAHSNTKFFPQEPWQYVRH